MNQLFNSQGTGSAQLSAVILCNGEFPRKEFPLYLLQNADVIICCDSERNVARLEKLGLEPTLIVGDMDSTPASIQKSYADLLVRVEEQDDNDLAKAFALLRERYAEVSDIHILGAGGKNEAHTVGNLGWLMEWERRSLAETGSGLAARDINVDMVSDWSTAFAVSPVPPAGEAAPTEGVRPSGSGEAPASDPVRSSAAHPSQPQGWAPPSNGAEGGTPLGSSASLEPHFSPLELYVGEGRRISFFATDTELRIKSQGLQWPLDGVDLSNWWGATLNRATADTVTLAFNRPSPLLVILD